MKLSIILVSYNNEVVLTQCLNSIKKYNDLDDDVEIIVIEQSPDDKIYESIRHNFSWVKVFRNVNNGFGCGNNKGVEYASGDYYLFLNTDTILIEPIFCYAIKKFENDGKLGAFGLRLLDSNKKYNLSFAFDSPFGPFKALITKITNYLGIFCSKSMYISGADLFIRANVFKKIGGFDSNIFMYFEDTLLCKMCMAAGYDVKFFDKKSLIHLQGGSTENKTVVTSDEFLKSYAYFLNKIGKDFFSAINSEIIRLRFECCILKHLSPRIAEKKNHIANSLKMYINKR